MSDRQGMIVWVYLQMSFQEDYGLAGLILLSKNFSLGDDITNSIRGPFEAAVLALR